MIANVKRVKDWIDENGERALFADGGPSGPPREPGMAAP
jgi:hypothetical protein